MTSPTPTATTVLLADGKTSVSTDSPEWREECRVRHLHVLTMRSLNRWARNDYVGNVRRAEGDLAADRLVQAYGDDFEFRKARQRDELRAHSDPAARV